MDCSSGEFVYSDIFKEAHAKSAASAINSLCEQGRLVLCSVDGDTLGWYPLKGTEFKVRQIDGVWTVCGAPLSYCRFVRAGNSGSVKCLTWGGELVFSVRSDGKYFDAGMDFQSFITISF